MLGTDLVFIDLVPLGNIENSKKIEMKFKETEKKFDPKIVYKDEPSPTKIMMSEEKLSERMFWENS